MKPLAFYIIIVGSVWLTLMVWMYLVSGVTAFLGFSLAPIMLIVGPSLVLTGSHSKLGVIITLVGGGIVTLYIAYGIIGLLHREPLQARPPYLLYILFGVVTLFGDVAALWLYRIVSTASGQSA